MSPDIFLISIAFFIFAFGFSRRLRGVRNGRPEECRGEWAYLLEYLTGHKKILRNPLTGTLHVIVFWGFLLPIVVVILAQMWFTLPAFLSLALSLALDVMGVLFLAAVLIFLVRRVLSNDALGPETSILPVLILLIILITGFLAEGFRLSITGTDRIWAAPVGWVLSGFLPASPVLMQLMIRIHFLSMLLLIAVIPFTFFRHLVTAPLNIFYRRKSPFGELRRMRDPNGPPGVNHVNDFTWKQLLEAEVCVSCGRCEENCPAFVSGKPLSPRKVVSQIRELVHDSSEKTRLDNVITADEIWSCTACMACVEVCPVFTAPLDKIIEIRRDLVMRKGKLPTKAAVILRNLEIYSDVYGKGPSLREDWTLSQRVRVVRHDDRDVTVLLWTGCSGAFHPRSQDTARALVSIMKKAGINFMTLGRNELCCGDPARRLGEESLFLELAQKNLMTFKRHNVKKIITLCPHCYNTLKNEYSKIDKSISHEFEVMHASEYVMELIRKRLIVPEYSLNKRITLHDPCYLGRANNIYEPLRDIIHSIPDARLTELDRSRENGFCCGAGGGGMWFHENIGKRINNIRAEEIAEKGVDVVCTACPYCHTMLSDGIGALELDNPPEVFDIIELVEAGLK